MEAESPQLKYLKALFYYKNVGALLKKASALPPHNDEFSVYVEVADRQLNFAYSLLKECYETEKESFGNMEIVIRDMNSLADRVFNQHIRSITPDPYRVLGIARGSPDNEIRKAYFKLARKLHPDTVPKDTSEVERVRISRQFQMVAAAYDTLTDPVKKQEFLNGQYNVEQRRNLENYHIQRKQAARQMLHGGQQAFYYQ